MYTEFIMRKFLFVCKQVVWSLGKNLFFFLLDKEPSLYK